MKRLLACVLAVAAFSLAAAGTAMAGQQSMSSGGGQTHAGAAFGFNAKDDQTGDFNYVGNTTADVTVNGVDIPAGSKFQGHCFDYMHVNFISSTEVRLFAQCRAKYWVDGGPPIDGIAYIQAHMIDNGEPGTDDRACIFFGLNPSPGTGDPGMFLDDCTMGTVLQSGNIQVKPA